MYFKRSLTTFKAGTFRLISVLQLNPKKARERLSARISLKTVVHYYSICYFIHIHLNYALYNKDHSLIGELYMVIIAINGEELCLKIQFNHEHKDVKRLCYSLERFPSPNYRFVWTYEKGLAVTF